MLFVFSISAVCNHHAAAPQVRFNDVLHARHRRGIKRGADATGRAVNKAAEKISGSSSAR